MTKATEYTQKKPCRNQKYGSTESKHFEGIQRASQYRTANNKRSTNTNIQHFLD